MSHTNRELSVHHVMVWSHLGRTISSIRSLYSWNFC